MIHRTNRRSCTRTKSVAGLIAEDVPTGENNPV